MALVQVSPQQQNYGAYANPTWVRANTEGSVALGESLVGIASKAGQHFIDKALNNRAIDEENREAKEKIDRQVEELRTREADAQARYNADLEKKRQEVENAWTNNETLAGIANMAGELGRKMANPEADKAELDFQALDQMPAGSYTPSMSIQGRIDDLEAKRGELDEWSTAKKRRDIRKDVLESKKGNRAERIAEYKAKYELLNTQVDDLIELNNFDIDPEVLKNVDESKIRKDDRQKYYLAKALGSGDYQSRIGKDGMVFIDYKWEDINGDLVKGTELVSALTDNIKERTTFGFNFEMSTDEGFNKLANTWANRVGKDISRFYTRVEYPLGPGQPGVTTLDREGLKKHLSVQNDLVGNLIDGFSKRAINEVDGINNEAEFMDRALNYVIDNYIPFEGSKYPVVQQQSYSGGGGGRQENEGFGFIRGEVSSILNEILLDQQTFDKKSQLVEDSEGIYGRLAGMFGGKEVYSKRITDTAKYSELNNRKAKINEKGPSTEKDREELKDIEEQLKSIDIPNRTPIKSKIIGIKGGAEYDINRISDVKKLTFDIAQKRIPWSPEMAKYFKTKEDFLNFIQNFTSDYINDYNRALEQGINTDYQVK